MKKWIALFLALMLTVGLFAGCAKGYDGETLEDGLKGQTSYFADSTESDKSYDRVVATCGDYKLTNRALQYYFWMQFLDFMNSYGSYAAYFGLDVSKPLCDQDSMVEGLNWEQYFVESAVTQFQYFAAVATAAKKAGIEVPADVQEYVDGLEDEVQQTATENGFEDGAAFLHQYYGPGATIDGLKDYMFLMGYISSVETEVVDGLEYNEEDLAAYFTEHEEEFTESGVAMDDTTMVNVRHILVTWEDADGDGTPTDEEKAAALSSAESILTEYQKDPSEEKFADLAAQYSTDPGSSSNGGLYEDVYPGQMVQPFNDWCFDAARQPGDTDIVETTYGYHVMYYVSKGDTPYWQKAVLDKGFAKDLLLSQCKFNIHPDWIVIGQSDFYKELMTGGAE